MSICTQLIQQMKIHSYTFFYLIFIYVSVISSSETHKVDVLVVGSGLSGLSTAFELAKKGLSVIILEANEKTGGRTRSLNNISVGGTYVPPNNSNLLKLAYELGIPPKMSDNSIRTIPESLFWDSTLGQHLYDIIEEITSSSTDQSEIFSHPKAIELDKYGFMEWLNLQNYSAQAKRSLYEYYITSENILEGYIDDLSALHAGLLMWARLAPVDFDWVPAIALQTLGNLNFQALSSVLHSEYVPHLPQLIFGRTLFPYMFSMWWEGGTGVFTQKLVQATLALGVDIRTGQLVEKITQDQDHVHVTIRQGSTIQARYAVLAIGPIAASEIKIENRFDNYEHVGAGTPFAGLNILLWYDSCWWKGNAYGFLADSTESDSVLGPAPVLPAACVPGDNALRTLSTPFITENYTDEYLIERNAEYIAARYPESRERILNFKKGTVFNWYQQNPNIRTGFAYKPGYLTKYGKFFLKPHHRVFVSGSERSIKGMNWMEGAVTSGFEVAKNILNTRKQ